MRDVWKIVCWTGENIWTEEQGMEGLNMGYIMRNFVSKMEDFCSIY
jgi:hypothetical protein